LFQLLKSDSPAVSFEAAWSLVSLSSAPTAVRAAAQSYASLLNTTNDNNVKLIVLDRLIELKKHHSKVVSEVLMDILRALSSPNIDISKKTLGLAIDMVGPRNIEEVMQVLKREIVRAQESDIERGDEYKSLLIQAIHKCAIRYAEVADSVVFVLLDFVSGDSGYNVLTCVKSIIEQYPKIRVPIVKKLLSNLDEVTNADAMRVALWILGEYCDDQESDVYECVHGLVGDAPFQPIKSTGEASEKKADSNSAAESVTTTKNIVLADGTYASVTSTETIANPSQREADKPLSALRTAICNGNMLVGSVVAVTLTKIYLKLEAAAMTAQSNLVRIKLGVISTIVGLGKFAESKRGGRVGVYADSIGRFAQCCRVLLDPSVADTLRPIFLSSGREAFGQLLVGQKASSKPKTSSDASQAAAAAAISSQPDDLIQFRQLRAQAVQGGIEVDLMDADDISRAVGIDASGRDTSSRLKHVYQLTGYSDPVYAEASLTVHDYDIILEILIINRTPSTLTNLTVELATMGDLRIVERPQSFTIGPLDERILRANIKVSSTETGHIFGTIVFDNASNAQKTYVTINDIQLDIMDYIRPSTCKHEDFRLMWEEFEWENKVSSAAVASLAVDHCMI
jgi:coatomer subunit beta